MQVGLKDGTEHKRKKYSRKVITSKNYSSLSHLKDVEISITSSNSDESSSKQIITDMNGDDILDTIKVEYRSTDQSSLQEVVYKVYSRTGNYVFYKNVVYYNEITELALLKRKNKKYPDFIMLGYDNSNIKEYSMLLTQKDSVKIVYASNKIDHSKDFELLLKEEYVITDNLSIVTYYDDHYKLATWNKKKKRFYGENQWIIGDSIPVYDEPELNTEVIHYFSGSQRVLHMAHYHYYSSKHGQVKKDKKGWSYVWVPGTDYSGWIQNKHLSDYSPVSYFKYEKF